MLRCQLPSQSAPAHGFASPAAQRFRTIRYEDVLSRGLDVMDQAAFILARDRSLPIHVFAAEQPGVMEAICRGADTGTYIGPGVSTTLE